MHLLPACEPVADPGLVNWRGQDGAPAGSRRRGIASRRVNTGLGSAIASIGAIP